MGSMPRSLLCSLVVLLLTACSEPVSETELTLWAMGREGQAVQALTADFERQHPDIRVRVQQIPWSAAHEKLLTAFVGDVLPDIFQLGSTWVAEFAALDALQPMDAHLDNPNDFFAGILSNSQIDGRLMAVPWYVDTRLLYYRKDLLRRAGVETPPRTWAEWGEAMSRIKAIAGPEEFALLMPLNEWQPLAILAMQAGSSLLSDTDQYGDFNGNAFRRAFRFYLELYRKAYAPGLTETQMSNPYQAFAQGHFAFYLSGPWNISEFRKRLPPELQDSWETAPMPGPDAPGVSLAGGSSLAISRTSRHSVAAQTLVQYLTDPERQVRFYELTGDLPTRQSAWQHPELRQAPHTPAFHQQLDAVVPTPRIPEWERIAAKISHYAEKTVRGELTEEAALNALDAEVDQILSKRRWLLGKSQEVPHQ